MKLSDFGLTRVLDGETAEQVRCNSSREMSMVFSYLRQMFCGTVMYMAPEITLAKMNKLHYSFQVDAWSLGVMMFFM